MPKFYTALSYLPLVIRESRVSVTKKWYSATTGYPQFSTHPTTDIPPQWCRDTTIIGALFYTVDLGFTKVSPFSILPVLVGTPLFSAVLEWPCPSDVTGSIATRCVTLPKLADFQPIAANHTFIGLNQVPILHIKYLLRKFCYLSHVPVEKILLLSHVSYWRLSYLPWSEFWTVLFLTIFQKNVFCEFGPFQCFS